MIKICECCGKEFKADRKTRKYCSNDCRSKGYSKNMKGKLTIIRNKEKETHVCLNCGKEFEHKSDNTNTYCSQECWKEYKSKERKREYIETHSKICKYCGKEFIADNASEEYCSDECRYNNQLERFRQRSIEQYKAITFNCKYCGQDITTEYGDKRTQFCSYKCGRKYVLKHVSSSKHKDRIKRYEAKHNTRIQYDSTITLEQLFHKDKGVCKICGQPCNYEDYITTGEGYFIAGNDYPSIDHITPISMGGSHTWNNVQLAHRSCNSLKSNKVS